MTVILTVVSFAVALAVGTVIAAFRVSPVPPLRAFATFYVEVLRNTPLPVLFVLFYSGLTKVGIRYSSFVSAIIVLGAYTSTFVAETVRAGVNTVARGQAEAARSLGLTFPQTLGVVVLPQAFRTVVAPLGSVFIALVKNSAIASVVAVFELTALAGQLARDTARPIPVFVGAAVGYVLIAVPSGWVIGVIERRVAIKR